MKHFTQKKTTLFLSIITLIAHSSVSLANPYQVNDALFTIAAVNTDLNEMDLELDSLMTEEAHAPDGLVNETRTRNIEAKLIRRIPRSLRRMSKKMNRWSDARVSEELLRLQEIKALPSHVQTLISDEFLSDREKVLKITEISMFHSAPKAAREISAAGGIIPYVFTAKKHLKEFRSQITTQKLNNGAGKTRSPASDDEGGIPAACLIGIAATVLVLTLGCIFFGMLFLLGMLVVSPITGAICSNY